MSRKCGGTWDARISVPYPKEALHDTHIGRPFVIRQAFHEDSAVLLFEYAVIEQHQQASVMKRANEASEALFQGYNGGWDLILEEGVAAAGIDCLDSRRDHWITGHCEGQAVDNHATQLLPLNVHTLPERRCGEQHGIWGQAKFLEQGAFRRISLP